MPGQQLSVTQLIAGAGATVTATVAASYFGVGGTLIGAGAVSVLSTVGATVYQHFLDRGKAQIAAKIPVRVGGGTADDPGDVPRRPWPKWYVLAGGAVGVFLAVMGLVTAFELVTGRPLANTVQGRAGGGTSVHPARVPVRPAPGPGSGSVVTDEATPAATPSAQASEGTPTPSGTPSAVPSPSPSTTGPAATRSPVPLQPLPSVEDPDPLRTP